MFTIQLNPKHNIMLEVIGFLSSFASFDPKHNTIRLDPKMLYSNKSSLMICVLINRQSVETSPNSSKQSHMQWQILTPIRNHCNFQYHISVYTNQEETFKIDKFR